MGLVRVHGYEAMADPRPARWRGSEADETSGSEAITLGSIERVAQALDAGVLQRGFDGDAVRLRRFVTVLASALPPGTTIALRGSAVAGKSYKTGDPFDAAGPRTSDLDVVVVGEPVLALFVPDAQLLGGINTLPLSDEATWVAPDLDRARRRAQAIARRPVSVQAMAGWFLDLRTLVQGQPYVVLNGDM